MNNSESIFRGCYMIVVIGTLLVLFPIVITLQALLSGSTPVIVSYIIIMFSMIACFSFIENTRSKFILAGILVFIFICIFHHWHSKSELGKIGRDDLENFMWQFICPFSLMSPCYFVGNFIKDTIRRINDSRNEKKKKEIIDAIIELNNINASLNDKIKIHKTELKLISLIEMCGGDVSYFYANVEFEKIATIEKNIVENKNKINELRKELTILKKLS